MIIKGRSYGRASSDQTALDDAGLAFHVSPAPSVAGGRRTRGFQPSEVNKPKQDAEQDCGPANKFIDIQASTSAETPIPMTPNNSIKPPPFPQTSTSTKASARPEPPATQHAVQVPDHELVTQVPQIPVQKATKDHSCSELDNMDIGAASRSNPHESSSVRIVNPQRQPSCWSKAATSGWDSGSANLNSPAWMLKAAQVSDLPNAPKRANMANLPPYKFPHKKEQDAPSSSFDRQVASRGRGGAPQVFPQVTKSLPRWGSSQLQDFPPLHSKSQGQDSYGKDGTEAKNNKALEQAFAEHQAVEPLMSSKDESNDVPSHPRAANDPLDIAAKAEAKPIEDVGKLPPHLRKSITSPEAPIYEGTRIGDREGKQTIVDKQKCSVPPHLQGRAPHKIRPTEESNTITAEPCHLQNKDDQPIEHIDKVDTGLNASHSESKNPIATQAETCTGKEGLKETTQPTQPNGFGVPNKPDDQVHTLPPHLRASKSTSTPESVAMNTTDTADPEANHSSGSKPRTTKGMQSSLLKDVTKARQNGKVGSTPNGATLARCSELAVKVGKKLIANGQSANHEPGLVSWDGNMMPPSVGADWDDSQHYDPSGREGFSVIEAWREEQATDADLNGLRLDIDSPGFQTGSGLAGGIESFMSPIDDAEHVAIPNNDDFTKARRDQNAAAAIEAMKAKSAVSGTSPKSDKEVIRTRREHKLQLKEQDSNRVILPNQHAPEANIYLRPAEHKDMRQCADIYNHYVREKCSAPEFCPVNELHWRDRLQEAHDEGNPFIVAIHMGQKRENNPKNIRRRKQETVVGFAVATDFGLQKTCWRYTKEMDLWVHNDQLHQGIGRTMLDRMLSAMDPGYHLLECAPFLGDYQLDRWIGGGHCITRTVLVNIIHSDEDKADVEWKKKWLSSDRNNFRHTGTLAKFGQTKDGKA